MEWENASRRLWSLRGLRKNWDGEGADEISAKYIASAAKLLVQLRFGTAEVLGKKVPQRPPDDIYPLCEGNIIMEWRLPEEVIVRVEVEGEGVGQIMITYPSEANKKEGTNPSVVNKKAEFVGIKW